MITNGIQNRSDVRVDPRTSAQDSNRTEELYNEFSQTLDEIASKVFTSKHEEIDYLKNFQASKKPVEQKSTSTKKETKGTDSGVDTPEAVRLSSTPADKSVETAAVSQKASVKAEKEKPEKTGEKPEKKAISKDSDKGKEAATTEETAAQEEPELADAVDVEEEATTEGELPQDDKASAEQIAIAASQLVPVADTKELEPVKDSEAKEAGSEGINPELPEPFSDEAPVAETPVAAAAAQAHSADPAAAETAVSEAVAAVSKEATAVEGEKAPEAATEENIAVPTGSIELLPEAATKVAPEAGLKTAEDKVADSLAKVIQDILTAQQNDLTSQSLTKLMAPQASEEASSVLKRLYGANRLQDMVSNPSQTQAQGLQLNGVGAFKQADSAQFGDGKASAKPLPKAVESRTMEKVENALKEVARSKDGKTISVRLDPPELGTLKVEVSIREGGLHARLVAESPQVNNMLREKTHEVVQMLRKLGLNLEKVTVSVGSGTEQQNNGTAGSFESFKNKEGGDLPNQGQGNGSRSHGAMMTAGRENARLIADDHWIA